MALMKRLKEKLKTIVSKGKKAKASLKQLARTRTQDVRKSAPAQEGVLGYQETAVGTTKFSHPEPPRFKRAMPHELPAGYGQDKIILQVRDPWWLHSYWEVTQGTWERFTQQLQDAFHHAKRVIRVYDVSQIIFNGRNAHRYFDIEVHPEANNWYIDTAGPGRSWCVDYGLRLPNGEFITIVRSNTVMTPLDGPSWITDEEWMIPEEMFAKLYGMGFGLGQSSPVGKAWQERVKKALFSGVLASPGITSVSSPVRGIPKERAFWLVVDCELIVYGATEPDAKLTVQGKSIKLRRDGTFTLLFALPDGKQVIPVKAVSADNEEERSITPIVTRETKIG
ncbi:MAG: DUF4912 domain-containing protein [Candidatus Omnitrophica bacterium]|nr:DUF4912 domain-containing protein [Candidatus Omnitrophota bacterium]